MKSSSLLVSNAMIKSLYDQINDQIKSKKYNDDVCNILKLGKKCIFSENDYKKIEKVIMYPNCTGMKNVSTIQANIDNSIYKLHILSDNFDFDTDTWRKIHNIEEPILKKGTGCQMVLLCKDKC